MSRADLTSIIAIVPVSSVSEAKSRLGEPLDPEERKDLVIGLLRRTVTAALESRHLSGVMVVSKDEELLAKSRAIGAATLAQRGGDLNIGLSQARLAVAPEATAVLILPADLPMVSPAELDRLVEAADVASLRSPAQPLVVLVPDHHRTGTNALLVSPPTAIPFRFGDGSRAAHAAEAVGAHATYEEVLGPLTFDVDTAEDLLRADMSGLGHESGR